MNLCPFRYKLSRDVVWHDLKFIVPRAHCEIFNLSWNESHIKGRSVSPDVPEFPPTIIRKILNFNSNFEIKIF